jgi:hypothetical protein
MKKQTKQTAKQPLRYVFSYGDNRAASELLGSRVQIFLALLGNGHSPEKAADKALAIVEKFSA